MDKDLFLKCCFKYKCINHNHFDQKFCLNLRALLRKLLGNNVKYYTNNNDTYLC